MKLSKDKNLNINLTLSQAESAKLVVILNSIYQTDLGQKYIEFATELQDKLWNE